MEKSCTVCGLKKVLKEFPKNKSIKSGYDARCKDCRNEYLKEYRNNPDNKKKAKLYQKEYIEENKENLYEKRFITKNLGDKQNEFFKRNKKKRW